MKHLLSILLSLLTLTALTLAAADPSPDRLNDAIAAAAKKANAQPKPAKQKKPGAKPRPQKLPNLGSLDLSGMGIAGGVGTKKNWKPKCKAKNKFMPQAINKLCSKAALTVPSDFASNGWCVVMQDPGKTVVDHYGDSYSMACAKVGSKKKKCKPARLAKKKCVRKLMEVCAKGDGHGKGKAADGECFQYQTGYVDYSKEHLGSTNTFWNWNKLG